MNKIFKYTFNIPQLAIVNGELVEIDSKKETHTFTLLHGGIGVFEENYGKSLVGTITKYNNKNQLDIIDGVFGDVKFIQDLACASWVKLENGTFQNDRMTAQEFKELEVFKYLSDTNFVVGLLMMATACVLGEQKPVPAQQTNKKRKNA